MSGCGCRESRARWGQLNVNDRSKLVVLLSDRGIRLLASMANTVLIARALPRSDVGTYAAALVFAAVADTVASLGLPGILPARVALLGAASRRRAFDLALATRLLALLIVVLGIGIWGAWTRGATSWQDPRLLMVAALLLSHWALGDAFLQGIGVPQRGAVAKSVVVVLFLGARFAVVRIGHPGLLTFVALYAAEQACLSAASLVLCFTSARAGDPVAQPGPSLDSRALLRYSAPMWLSQVATLVYMRADQMLLTRLAGPETLAGYAIAVQLVEQAYTIPVIINSITVSRAGAARARSEADFSQVMVETYRRGLLLSVACAAGFAAAAPFLVVRLFGEPYRMAAPIVGILALTIPFVALGTIQLNAIFTGSRPQVQLTKTVIAAVLSAPVALAGWYAAGVHGLALATVAVQMVSTFAVNFWVDRESFRQQVLGMAAIVRWTSR